MTTFQNKVNRKSVTKATCRSLRAQRFRRILSCTSRNQLLDVVEASSWTLPKDRVEGVIAWRFLGDALLESLDESLLLGLLIQKPIGRPNAIQVPSATFDDLLPQSIAIACRSRRVVSRPIAFDSQQIRPISLASANSDVDEIARHPNLKHRFEPIGFHDLGD